MDLKIIIEQLSNLIDPSKSIIDITNIATYTGGDSSIDSKSPIILSIINIEEDKIQKNQSVYIRNTNDKTTVSRYNQPTQHLIISLLFSSYTTNSTNYLTGIDKLKSIVYFFQQNKSFYYKIDDTELITYDTFLSKTDLEKEDYEKITIEFVSMSLEQLNQMWSFLGSKYMPSMLFKMRLCSVQESAIKQDRVLKKIKINLWENNLDDPIGKKESFEFENQEE